eukprot:TRINITY_DN4519_c0_g1_i4.p1 TRINITY_DN4519_c0_g1~~TRINITY_DN4519_c0_g1_i4.p1  ORF type:complete len:214 (-),score=51.24 TRINITY_DN4519_c0_g1_i4:127-768(-)
MKVMRLLRPQQLKQITSGMTQIKVVIVGDSGVGKTSLLQRFVFNNFREDIQPTVSSMLLTKAIRVFNKNCEVNFVLWDTAGQERYRSLSRMYYQDAAAVIIVYDITKRNTFESAKNWLEEIKTGAVKDPVIALVGNKADLVMEEEVEPDEAQEFAEQKGMKFSLASAKIGEGIIDSFEEIACELLEKNVVSSDEDKIRLDKLAMENHRKNCCQ